MRTGWGGEAMDCGFDVPPRLAVAERRMAGRAIDAWTAGGRVAVAGFDGNCLTVVDRDGAAVVDGCCAAITGAFGLVPGMVLSGCGGLAGEIVAACDLIALRPEPVPFEASLMAPGRALMLVRGVALPLFSDDGETGRVQVVVNWREVLNRAATTRLRREIGAILRHHPVISAKSDPFSPKSAG